MAVQDFNRIMTPKSDEELLRIVEEENQDYQKDALEAAKKELDSRGIPYREGSRAHGPASFAEKYYETSNRFWDYLIDSLVFGFIGAIAATLVNADTDSLGWSLAYSATVFLYYFLMEATLGKTVGKLILGLRVVDINGKPPSQKALLLRTLCRFIPFEALSFLYGGEWSKDGRLRGNMHDQLSKTYVVSEREIARDRSTPDSISDTNK